MVALTSAGTLRRDFVELVKLELGELGNGNGGYRRCCRVVIVVGITMQMHTLEDTIDGVKTIGIGMNESTP